MQLVNALHCKLSTSGKQLPVFLLEVSPGIDIQTQRYEVSVFALHHRDHISQ